MTTASPTPYPVQSLGSIRAPRPRLPSRSNSSRAPAASTRRYSPIPALVNSHGFSANAAPLQSISIGDSSDDEGPPPMVAFSAQTQAILEDRPSLGATSSHASASHNTDLPVRSRSVRSNQLSRDATPSREPLRISRKNTPSPDGDGRPMRIVRISPKRSSPSILQRERSEPRRRDEEREGAHLEYITPAPIARVGRGSQHSRSGSAYSSATHSGKSYSSDHVSSQEQDMQRQEQPQDEVEQDHNASQGPESTYRGRVRPASEAVPSSMRVKRVPTTGSFLRGAPMRRGVRRRQSDEDQSPIEDPQEQIRDYQDAQNNPQQPNQQQPNVVSRDFAANPPSRRKSQNESRPLSSHAMDRSEKRHRSPSVDAHHSRQRSDSQAQPVFKVPMPPMDSFYDQENEPPPTFKRNKPTSGMLGDKIQIHHDEKPARMLADTPKSPPRAVLAPLSQNTPMRAAPPPPPKMSVLETATANAGASTVKSKKKRSHVTVNGKVFALRGRLGKGGSSDVWRVMAENDKMFALKKVNLEDCNVETVRGYKGEIDLLKKLEDDDRVVSYPAHGIGGVAVPSSLRNLLKRCLQRDFRLRPTIAQMLDDHDTFLNPDAQQEGRVPMTEDMLAQILRNVVNRCKDPKRGIPTEAELRAYPKGFMDRIRASLEKNG
ncbi:hypothetical protein FH972_023955 [Carpinus fangiana]|uniref:Protein kinase domain-containing protein n=1 Tax=Carpinus fangiana TaxID=176857 RepID=A0A5N6KX17_9ROSI|nr:hypothetical protein FH972_023955 [Carpinus fangiana]